MTIHLEKTPLAHWELLSILTPPPKKKKSGKMNDKRVNGDILLLHLGADGKQSTSCLPAEQYWIQKDHMRSKVLIAEINWAESGHCQLPQLPICCHINMQRLNNLMSFLVVSSNQIISMSSLYTSSNEVFSLNCKMFYERLRRALAS